MSLFRQKKSTKVLLDPKYPIDYPQNGIVAPSARTYLCARFTELKYT